MQMLNIVNTAPDQSTSLKIAGLWSSRNQSIKKGETSHPYFPPTRITTGKWHEDKPSSEDLFGDPMANSRELPWNQRIAGGSSNEVLGCTQERWWELPLNTNGSTHMGEWEFPSWF
ncbi:hypothetical protein C8R45DRAFT_941351 [Mycena sanguinolenta]|nr:hypothetical protein C8R45DRAFT_941351 [Mycena sanguinolenta]